MTIDFGIVGCGHIAEKHASALAKIENARLTTLCDIHQERTRPLEEQFGAAAYSCYEEFLRHPQLDAVIICTPSGLHYELGEKAAAAGKHFLVEKPFVLNPGDGERLVASCKSRGVRLGVVHPNRTKAAVLALKKALKEGWFGTITHASAVLRWNRSPEYFSSAPWRGTRLLDGGILFNQAIHNLDLFNWLAGPVKEVFAYGATRIHKIECEDVCVCAAQLESGALGLIEAAVTLYPRNLEESLAIFGSHGTAVLGGVTLSKIKEWKFAHLTEEEALEQKESVNNTADKAGHLALLEDFLSSIINNHPPLVSGEEALRTIYLINSIYQSMAEGRPAPVNPHVNLRGAGDRGGEMDEDCEFHG